MDQSIKYSKFLKAKVLIILLLNLPSICVFSQGIRLHVNGIVINNSHQALPYSTVRLMNKNNVLSITSSDSTGRFSIFFSGKSDSNTYIVADYITHNSKPVFFIHGVENLEIIIDTTYNILKEVRIEGNDTQLSRQGDRYIFVPGKELVKGANVLDIMRHAPLIAYDDRSDAFSIINKSNTIVYINNIKSQIPAQMLQQMLRSLPASDIKSVEIITNPGSEYNASTQGGIININLKRQPYEGWLGNLMLQSQQSKYNTTILNGSINYRKNKLAIQIIPFFNRSYNYYTENDQLAYTDGTNQQNAISHFRRYSVVGGGVNLDYEVSNDGYLSFKYWRTNVYGNSKNTAQSQFSTLAQQGTDALIAAPYNGNDFYTYNFGNVNYHQNIGKKKDSYIDVNLDYNHFFQKRDITGSFQTINLDNGSVQGQNDYYNHLPQDFNNFSASIDYVKPLPGNFKLLTGVQYSNTNVSSDLSYYTIENGLRVLTDSLSKDYYYKETYGAGYISVNKSFSNKFYASVGIRLENTSYSTIIRNTSLKSDSSYWNLFPSASLSYSPNPNNHFSYSLSRKIVRPNIELLFPGRIYNGPNDYTENNPFLQPSTFLGNEFTYLLNQKYSLSLNYAVAHNSFSQFIIPVRNNQTNSIKTTYSNYGSVNNLSIVFYMSHTMIKKIWDMYLTPYFNYGHYQGIVESSNLDVTNKNFNVTLDNAWYLSKDLTGYLTFKYFGRSRDISQEVLNASTTLNITLKKTIKKFTLMLIVNDLYNGSSLIKTNHFSNYLLSQDYSAIDRYRRSAMLQLRYSFGNTQLKGNKGRKTANEDIKNRAN